MRNPHLVAMTAGAVAFAACALIAAPPQSTAPKQTPGTAASSKALVDRYCIGCHNQKLKTAKLELDVIDIAHPEKDALTWERAIRKLRGGMMPPLGLPSLTLVEVNAFATYLEDSLDKASAANFNPGSVRIHRLNRGEYANAVRDLFGIEVDGANLLPTDDISDGFDNIAKALTVSPSFMDQSITAARAVVKQALGTAPSTKEVKNTLRGMDSSVSLPPGARSGITARYLFPYEGDYELRAVGNPAVFTVDGAAVDTKGRNHLTAGFHSIVAANPSHSLQRRK